MTIRSLPGVVLMTALLGAAPASMVAIAADADPFDGGWRSKP